MDAYAVRDDAIAIRQAGPEDCLALSVVGELAYRQHFTYLWTEAGLEQYLARAYAPAFFGQALAEKAVIWLAVHQQLPCGYLMYYPEKKLPGMATAGACINRIYLLARYSRQGLGSRLLAQAVALARAEQWPYLWLEVMQSNTRSMAFYRKHGFEVHGPTAYMEMPMRSAELAKMWWMKRVL